MTNEFYIITYKEDRNHGLCSEPMSHFKWLWGLREDATHFDTKEQALSVIKNYNITAGCVEKIKKEQNNDRMSKN